MSPRRHPRRPAMLVAAACGLGAGVLAGRLLPLHAALLIGWCVFVSIDMGTTLYRLRRATPETLRHRAIELEGTQGAVLGASIVGALASLAAVGWAIAVHPRHEPLIAYALPLLTVVLSWSFVHLLFALCYAHEYWQSGGGLEFAGSKPPEASDFLYFAFTMGMTAQTSDTAVSSTPMRRLALIHGLVAFVYNAAILAASVNVAASLLS